MMSPADALRAAEEKIAAAEGAPSPEVTPHGVLNVDFCDPTGNRLVGSFHYTVPSTAGDLMKVQAVAAALGAGDMAAMVAYLSVAVREAPAWALGKDAKPDWLGMDEALVAGLFAEVYQHGARFRERRRPRITSSSAGH